MANTDGKRKIGLAVFFVACVVVGSWAVGVLFGPAVGVLFSAVIFGVLSFTILLAYCLSQEGTK